MPSRNDYSGMAALSICESLLLAMNDRNLLPEREIMGVLEDAATSHESAAIAQDNAAAANANDTNHESDAETHRAVAGLINKIIAGGNSVRRP